MKKIIKGELGSFTEKDIKRYSRILNDYFKRKWRFIFVFLLASCSVQNDMDKDDFKKIPTKFASSFYDNLDTIATYDNRFITRSLIKEFIDTETVNYSIPIRIAINNDVLFLTFKDNNSKEFVLKLYGKKYKNRFVFFTNYDTVSFPFLFMSKQMKKYRIYLTSSNEIIFENERENIGMILFFGAENSSLTNYQFKLIENE